jgi:hypothetical protein
MRRAAVRLPPPDFPQQPAYRIHFLTGKRFWHQTIFCAWTFSRTAEVNVIPVIHDDGSMTPELMRHVRTVFPRAELITDAEATSRLEEHLPPSSFPSLYDRRRRLPLFRKLLDVHAGTSGWKLFLDSDMLFFRRPSILVDWLQAPDRMVHMVDVQTCYGYPLEFLSEQVSRPVPQRVNTGITGINSSSIDWEHAECLVSGQLQRFGPHYYGEQAIFAQLLSADRSILALPPADYLVMPDESEVNSPTAVVQHYVSQTKPWYYRVGWRNAMQLKDRDAAGGYANPGVINA